MPTVTNSCDEEEWPQNSSQNLHKYPWCTTLSYSHGYFCSFFIELNTLTSSTMTYGAQLFESVTVRLQIIINIKIRPCDLDLWPWKSIGFQTLLRTKYVPSLVKIHWRMLILVFTRMLCGKNLTLWPWPLTLKINKVHCTSSLWTL
jgi:hypothetical protein